MSPDPTVPVVVPRSEVSDRGRLWERVRHSQTKRGQLVRFVMVGGSTNVVYLGLYLALVGVGEQVANAVGVLVSTALANELHRLLTFRAAGRTSWWTAQWEGGGLAVVALAVSAGVLGVAQMLVPEAAPLLDALLVIAAAGLVGMVKFVAFRGWVFRARAEA